MSSIFSEPKLSDAEQAYRASELAQLDNDERKANAKRWAKLNGYEGSQGGFIYNNKTWKPICQGWWTFFDKYRYRMLADVQAGTFKISRSRKGGA